MEYVRRKNLPLEPTGHSGTSSRSLHAEGLILCSRFLLVEVLRCSLRFHVECLAESGGDALCPLERSGAGRLIRGGIRLQVAAASCAHARVVKTEQGVDMCFVVSE